MDQKPIEIEKTAELAEIADLESELFKNLKRVHPELAEDYETELSTRSNFILKKPGVRDFGGAGSSGFVFLSQSDPLDKEEGIWMSIGDLQNSGGNLGVLVKVSGTNLTDEIQYQINQNLRKLMQMKNIMVKGSGKEIWIRLSPNLEDPRQVFETLGALISRRLTREFPEIESVSVVFTVGSSVAYNLLDAIATRKYELIENIKAQVWKDRGYDFKECHVLGHCGKCADRNLCANVRKIDRLSQAHRVEFKENEKV